MATSMLVTLLLMAPHDPALLDFRGHAPDVVQRTLDDARPALEACLRTPEAPTKKKPVVVEQTTEHLFTLMVSASVAVAAVRAEGSPRLDEACARRLLLRLDFGRSRGAVSTTKVVVPLTCALQRGCAFPWTKAPDAVGRESALP